MELVGVVSELEVPLTEIQTTTSDTINNRTSTSRSNVKPSVTIVIPNFSQKERMELQRIRAEEVFIYIWDRDRVLPTGKTDAAQNTPRASWRIYICMSRITLNIAVWIPCIFVL